jgi:glucan phosphoethanolaminetransferase (alkaline phosphatase superfamily)
MIRLHSSPARAALRLALGLLLFAAAYAIINYRLLVQSILYRAAANDFESVAFALLGFTIQGLALLLAVALLPRRLFALLLALVAVSALVNITYADIVRDTIDLARMSWLLGESRQAGEAAGQFAGAALIAALKTALAVALLWSARLTLRPLLRAKVHRAKHLLPLLLAVLAPSFVAIGPPAAERNVYRYTAQILTAPPAPPRDAVTAVPDSTRQIEKIVWLIDESVSHAAFAKLVRPRLTRFDPVDFGEAAAIANCSSPAHVGLRSGLDVRRITPATDLRRAPTIWAYARKAGYRTMLIDGQVTGPPQNMMLPTERVLIDEYRAAAAGLRTDYEMARMLSAELRQPGKRFVYAVLRGVHFQYSDHYPEGLIPADSPVTAQYEAAVAYSRRGLFDALLADVDRERVAILYTSDHGQNVREGTMPHCSEDPDAAEFSIPLIAFLPRERAAPYAHAPKHGRSASQIFPTTLEWMGYDPAYAQARYDRDLHQSTARYVWLGRSVLPTRSGEEIDLHRESGFPGR